MAVAHVPITTASALRRYALSLPGAYEEFPWGERVIKVAKKIFVFLGRGHDASASAASSPSVQAGQRGAAGALVISVKLPQTGVHVLSLPVASPTAYGLGKSGWVSVRLSRQAFVPLQVMQDWIDESYQAIAPKKLLAQLPGSVGSVPGKTLAGASATRRPRRRSAMGKAAAG